MIKFDRGTQKVHGKLSKLSFRYIKGIPFCTFIQKAHKRYRKGTKYCTFFVPYFGVGRFFTNEKIIASDVWVHLCIFLLFYYFYKGDQLFDFKFNSLMPTPFQNRICYSKIGSAIPSGGILKERICSCQSKFFLLRLNPPPPPTEKE